MKKTILLLLILSTFVFANINVVVSYPFIGALTAKIGGDNVNVETLAKGSWDPHFVVPRPSLIRKVAQADLLIINGAQLEIGWMPPLINKSSNARIQPGSKGFLDLSHSLTLINKPSSVSRSGGDIHPDGNPHFSTDPYLIPILAKSIANRLTLLDPTNRDVYTQNYQTFITHWDTKLEAWAKQMKPLEGTKVVQYHELYNYFLKRFHLISVGNIEPLPGISPSSRHTLTLITQMNEDKVSYILQDVYHNPKTAKFLQGKTSAKMLRLPHDVNAVHEADSLEHLYDTIVNELTR